MDDEDKAFQLYIEFLKSHRADQLDELIAEHPQYASDFRRLAADRFRRRALARGGLGPIDPEEERRRERQAEALASLRKVSPRTWPYAEEETEIGRGSFGVVSGVAEARHGRRLALKRVNREGLSDEGGAVLVARRDRLLEEGRILEKLDHPGIVPLHATGVDEQGEPYLVLRFVEGDDLGHAIAEAHCEDVPEGERTLRTRRLVEVIRGVCDALASAHARGIIHRDIKPDNIRLGVDGEVSIIDWGLALDLRNLPPGPALRPGAAEVPSEAPNAERPKGGPAVESRGEAATSGGRRRTLDGTAVGTPEYMAPEQARGDLSALDARTDVYALGAVLHQALTGRRARRAASAFSPDASAGSTSGSSTDPSTSPPADPRLNRWPPALLAIVHKALSEDRGARYADAREMGDDLTAFLEQRVVPAYSVGPWAELRAWVARNRLASAGLGLALTIFVVATALLVDYSDRLVQSDEVADRQAAQRLLERAHRDRDRGAFQDVLDGLDDPLVRWMPDEDVASLEVGALLGLGRTAEARAVVEAARAAPGERYDAGDLLVDLARVLVAENETMKARDLVIEAADSELSPFARAVCEAWRDDSAVSNVIDQLSTALAYRPAEPQLRTQLAVTLTIAGRDREADAQLTVLETHGATKPARAICGVLRSGRRGRFQDARVGIEALEGQVTAAEVATLERLLLHFEQAQVATRYDFFAKADLPFWQAAVVDQWRLGMDWMALGMHEGSELLSNLMPFSVSAFFALHQNGMYKLSLWGGKASLSDIPDLEQVIVSFEAAVDRLPESSALYFLGLARLAVAHTQEHNGDHEDLLELIVTAESALRRSAEADAIAPGVAARARVWLAIVHEFMHEWAHEGSLEILPLPDAERQSIDNIDALLRLRPKVSSLAGSSMILLALRYDLQGRAATILDWARPVMVPHVAWHRDYEIRRDSGAPAAALEVARRWMKFAEPNKDHAKEALEEAEAAFEEWSAKP